MLVKVSDKDIFESVNLTPVIIFALNNQNNFFGFAKKVEERYFPELSLMKKNQNSLLSLIEENENLVNIKVISKNEHGLNQIKDHDLTLIGIKCYSLGIGWCGTFPLITKFIKDSGYKEPVSFVWPKEIYQMDASNIQEASIPIYFFEN